MFTSAYSGELKIYTSNGVLKESIFNSPRISRLLTYLLISHKAALTPYEIEQTIWPGDSANFAKNLKNLIYRLRQLFMLISDEQLIQSSAVGYQFNPNLNIMTDCQRFDSYNKASLSLVIWPRGFYFFALFQTAAFDLRNLKTISKPEMH